MGHIASISSPSHLSDRILTPLLCSPLLPSVLSLQTPPFPTCDSHTAIDKSAWWTLHKATHWCFWGTWWCNTMAVAEGTWTWTGVTAVPITCFQRKKKSPESEHQSMDLLKANYIWLRKLIWTKENCPYHPFNLPFITFAIFPDAPPPSWQTPCAACMSHIPMCPQNSSILWHKGQVPPPATTALFNFRNILRPLDRMKMSRNKNTSKERLILF